MMKNQSKTGRRDFIKKGTAAIGGTVLTTLPADLGAYVRGSDRVRIGLIGCGNRGAGAAVQALVASKSATLVAMGDTFRDRLDKSYAAILEHVPEKQVDVPESRKFTGFEAYQNVIDVSDAVLLVTPPPFRPIHFEAAVNAGKHVFMEKPLAVDVPGYHQIMEASELADKKGLTVVVGLQNRYNTSYGLLMEKIREGIVGDVASISVYYCVGAPVIHARKPDQTEMEYQMRNWRYFTWLWGGQLAGQSIHPIDAMNWLMRDYPVLAKGLGGRQVFSGPNQGNTYDHHFVEFEYSNGVKMNVQSLNINNCWRRIGWDIKCNSGSADEKPRIYDNHKKVAWRHDDRDDPNPYQVEHDVFLDSILNDKGQNDTEWGAKSTLTTIMGRMAMQSGQALTLDQVLASTRSILPEQFSWDAEMPDRPDETGNYPVAMPGLSNVL